MQKHMIFFMGLAAAVLSLWMADASATQVLRADESLTPAAGFHTYDGRIGHPLQSTSKAAQSPGGTGTFNTLSLWGGYIGAQTGHTETYVFGYFNIPSSVSCNSTNNLFAPWVGLDGGLYPGGSGTNNYVEQTGVAISCATGQPTYQGWYEMYPANPVYISTVSYPIHSGDVMGGIVLNNGSGSYTLYLCDLGPNGWSKGGSQAQWCFQTTQSGGWSGNSLSGEAVVESPTHSYPNFSTVTFANLGGTTQPSNCYNLFYTGTGTGNNQACAAGTTAPTLTAYNAGNGGVTETSTSGISYLGSNLPTLIANNITFNETFVHP